jgi:hypothetical protein
MKNSSAPSGLEIEANFSELAPAIVAHSGMTDRKQRCNMGSL